MSYFGLTKTFLDLKRNVNEIKALASEVAVLEEILRSYIKERPTGNGRERKHNMRDTKVQKYKKDQYRDSPGGTES